MKNPLLTELRKTLRETPAPAPASKPAAAAQPRAEEAVDDATLFARATRGVQRIQSEPPPAAVAPRKPDANTLHRRATATAEEAADLPVSDTAALLHAVGPEDSLSFARNGISPKVLQKLKQGQQPWQAAVDLHGCSVDAARDAVLTLLRNAARDRLQVVKIVHGKGLQNGQPLIKTCVNGWLRQLPDVLAFASALPRDGGSGAVYVLLKRQRADDE